jgi:hypothetical protein
MNTINKLELDVSMHHSFFFGVELGKGSAVLPTHKAGVPIDETIRRAFAKDTPTIKLCMPRMIEIR